VLGTNSIQEQGRNHQCASHVCSFFCHGYTSEIYALCLRPTKEDAYHD
jgi:hypothetical protein